MVVNNPVLIQPPSYGQARMSANTMLSVAGLRFLTSSAIENENAVRLKRWSSGGYRQFNLPVKSGAVASQRDNTGSTFMLHEL